MARGDGESGLYSWAPPSPLPAFEERAGPSSAKGAASVNVLSLGFAATAILLSLFLLMALFERFLRPAPPPPPPSPPPAASAPSKLHATSSLFPCDRFVGVSVLMPGHSVPTFIAHPVPLPPHQAKEAALRPESSCTMCVHSQVSSCKNSLSQVLPISTADRPL